MDPRLSKLPNLEKSALHTVELSLNSNKLTVVGARNLIHDYGEDALGEDEVELIASKFKAAVPISGKSCVSKKLVGNLGSQTGSRLKPASCVDLLPVRPHCFSEALSLWLFLLVPTLECWSE